jgi:aspartyl/asparaginyl beta-hydroxylase (cupin superfamily)
MDQALMVEADRAVQRGELHRARELLVQAVGGGGGDPTSLLKLAGLQRATGELRGALVSVERALALEPRDFTALLMRASLLQRLGHPSAGEAWTHALAQRPEGNAPPHLVAVVGEAERRSAEWLRAREDRLERGMAEAERHAGEEERERIQRFRSNALRRTRVYHSEPTHFSFPGLREREYHPRSLFPWLSQVEAAADVIRSELQAVMAGERAELIPYVQYDDHLPMDQWRPLNRSRDWTAIHLLRNGAEVAANSRYCPRTMQLLRSVPQPDITGASPNAMFSLLAPQTAIPPHTGINNARLVCHLPLIVPEGCWFRVGAEVQQWQPGQAFVFDDTIEHEACNPSDELRVVLIFDVWHPDLTAVERDAVAALVGAETARMDL